ncbi:FtsX-like permease family protein [Haladaptatus sp. R4]|uniref:ABC transporter permease n=1 Tax=Haladaptatus sp. R4 TaxID=1679489 RepID=UPI003743E771
MVVRGVRFGSFANVSDATLVRGRRPHGPDEAVVGTDLARTLGLSTNDSVTLGGSTTPGLDRVKIVGEYAAPGPYDRPTARLAPDGATSGERPTGERADGSNRDPTRRNRNVGEQRKRQRRYRRRRRLRTGASTAERLDSDPSATAKYRLVAGESCSFGSRRRPKPHDHRLARRRRTARGPRPPSGGTTRHRTDFRRGTTPHGSRRLRRRDRNSGSSRPRTAEHRSTRARRGREWKPGDERDRFRRKRGGMKTGPNGTVRVHLGDSGPATIRATAGDRSATTTVRVSRSASRLPVGRLQVQPDRPTLLGRPTARLAVSNPWNETISRRVAVVSGSQRFTRNLTLGPGEQRTVTPQLDRRSPGSYAVTAAVDGRTIARTNYRVVGDDRVVSALANSGRSGGTGISRAITTAFGDLNLLIGVFVCLAGVMTVGSTTATVAYTVHSRRQVVGVHRATGASPLRILSLVLLDAITVGTVATILALVVAVVAVSLLAEAGLLVLYGVRITPLLTPRVAASVVAGGIGVMCLSALLVAFALLRTTPDSLLSGYRVDGDPERGTRR